MYGGTVENSNISNEYIFYSMNNYQNGRCSYGIFELNNECKQYTIVMIALRYMPTWYALHDK